MVWFFKLKSVQGTCQHSPRCWRVGSRQLEHRTCSPTTSWHPRWTQPARRGENREKQKVVKNLRWNSGESTESDEEGEKDCDGIGQDLQHHAARIHLIFCKLICQNFQIFSPMLGQKSKKEFWWRFTLTGSWGEPSFSSFLRSFESSTCRQGNMLCVLLLAYKL